MKIEIVDINNQDFRTHANYVDYLSTLTADLKIRTNCGFQEKIKIPSKILDKKIKIVNLSAGALKKEQEIVSQIPEYASVASTWIAVKAYYLFFNLLLITKYLISCQAEAFNFTHMAIQKDLARMIEYKTISFNVNALNINHGVAQALAYRAPTGANLKRLMVDGNIRQSQILKKLANYKRDEFRRISKIKKLSGNKLKEFNKKKINFFEFFYLYRIKSNYRDLEFLSKEINEREFVDFYTNYFSLTLNFYQAFKDFINLLSKTRLDKELL